MIIVLGFNARCLRNKIDELKCLVITENINVIAITETFIDMANNDLLSKYSKERYKSSYRSYQLTGGGVALYVAPWHNLVQLSPNDTYIERVW